MFRVGLGGLIHETNTFAKTPAVLDNFLKPDGFYPGLRSSEEILRFGDGRFNIAASGFLSAAPAHNFQVVPLIWCGAEPSAPIAKDVFDHLLGLLIDSLKANMPYDGLFLDLHGAMVYGNLQDGEIEILRQVRQVVGEIPIVVSLDLHGNIAPECFTQATALIGYRTYPHVDGFENGERCADMLAYLIKGGQIFGSFRQVPFLMPSTTQATTREPAQGIYNFLEELERVPGVLSVTMMEGFPPCDQPHTGPSIFAYAETSLLAQGTVDWLLEFILSRESQFSTDLYPCEQAVKKAIHLATHASGPVLMADIQDNAGGGSPSDSTWLLYELARQRARNTAIGLLFDPDAALKAHQSGKGTEVELSVGGHSLPGHHPFTSRFKVEALHEGTFIGTGPMVKGRQLDLGKMAHLVVDDIHLVVSSVRMQALDQSQFRVVGIEPASMSILALKSANHYRADFGPIAGGIINVEAPSAIIEDPSKIPYTQLREGVRLKGLGPVFHRPN
ncbi:MAG: hypothetical protein FD147_1538 [Chloroflexi bacterium]|nr:MAG: hypothetical protein FD147_1538 [Chloroflexota bacterium]MBA4375650.1 microcystin degradation protein MlrC [Anaerolinea sp.]